MRILNCLSFKVSSDIFSFNFIFCFSISLICKVTIFLSSGCSQNPILSSCFLSNYISRVVSSPSFQFSTVVIRLPVTSCWCNSLVSKCQECFSVQSYENLPTSINHQNMQKLQILMILPLIFEKVYVQHTFKYQKVYHHHTFSNLTSF